MNEYLEQRCMEISKELVLTELTIRQLADVHCMSKSSVHKDVTERISEVDPILAEQCRDVLDRHIATRAIKGGAATAEKFRKLREAKEADVNGERHR